MRIRVTYEFDKLPKKTFDIEIKKDVYQIEYIDTLLSKLSQLEIKKLISISNHQYGKSNLIKWLIIENVYDFKKNGFWLDYKKTYINKKPLDRPFLNIVLITNNESLSLKIDVQNVIGEGMLTDLINTAIELFEERIKRKVRKYIYFKMSNKFSLKWLKKEYTEKIIK